MCTRRSAAEPSSEKIFDLFLYIQLNAVEAGGHTVFTKLNITIHPVKVRIQQTQEHFVGGVCTRQSARRETKWGLFFFHKYPQDLFVDKGKNFCRRLPRSGTTCGLRVTLTIALITLVVQCCSGKNGVSANSVRSGAIHPHPIQEVLRQLLLQWDNGSDEGRNTYMSARPSQPTCVVSQQTVATSNIPTGRGNGHRNIMENLITPWPLWIFQHAQLSSLMTTGAGRAQSVELKILTLNDMSSGLSLTFKQTMLIFTRQILNNAEWKI